MGLMATVQLDRTGLEYDHISCFIGRAAKNDGKKERDRNKHSVVSFWAGHSFMGKHTSYTGPPLGMCTWQCCGNSPSRGGRKMPWSVSFFPSSPGCAQSVIITLPFWAVLESRASSLLETGEELVGESLWTWVLTAAAWVGMREVRPMPGPQWGKTESHGAFRRWD